MKSLRVLFISALALLLGPGIALSQPASAVQAQTPLTRDLTSLITLTAQGAATVSSADQSGFNVARITCVFRSASQTGTPSSTFKIQGKDATSGQYYDMLTSAAVTTSPTTNAIYMGAGVQTAANVSAGLPLPRVWRVSVTVGGTTPAVTGTVGCSVQ